MGECFVCVCVCVVKRGHVENDGLRPRRIKIERKPESERILGKQTKKRKLFSKNAEERRV